MRKASWLLLLVLLTVSACSRPAAVPPAPETPAPATPETSVPEKPPVAVPPVAAPAMAPGAGITGGGAPGLRTVVAAVTVTSDGGNAQIQVTFRDGVPVWAAHVLAHGQGLQVDLGAPLADGVAVTGKSEPIEVSLSGSPHGALLSVWGIPQQVAYQAGADGRTLTLSVRPNGPAPLEGHSAKFPAMAKAGAMVEAFLKARVGAPGPGAGALAPAAANSLSDLAKLQYEHLYGTEPLSVTSYRIWRQSGQWPGDVLFYLVRLEGDGWFADEMIYATPKGDEPVIAMVLGHPPVAVPADADGKAALRTADAFLEAWSRRDVKGMWDALSPSAQQKLGSANQIGSGLSNPHPFRYEIHAVHAAGPGCWQFDVLRSQEYTGEGELGSGMDTLYVTKEEGRFGVLWEGTCAP